MKIDYGIIKKLLLNNHNNENYAKMIKFLM